MIISHITLLPIDNEQAVAVDIGIAINPIPVRLNVIELDVVAIITNVSKDFIIVVFVLFFLYFFFDLLFSSLKYVIICLMLLLGLLKLFTSFNSFLTFVQYHNFLVQQMGLIYLFFVPLR